MKTLFTAIFVFALVKGWAQPFTNTIYTPPGNPNSASANLVILGGDSLLLYGSCIDDSSGIIRTFTTILSNGQIVDYRKGSSQHTGFTSGSNSLIVKDGYEYMYYVSRDTNHIYRTHLTKANIQGDTSWVQQFQWGEFMAARALKEHPDGGFVLVGVTQGTIGDYDMFLLKTDENGNEEFRKRFEYYQPYVNEQAYSVHIISDNEYLVGGIKMVTPTSGGLFYMNGIYLKYNTNGSTQILNIGRPLQTEGITAALISLPDNKIIIPTAISDDLINSSFQAAALIKIDEGLNIIWKKMLDTSFEYLNGVGKGLIAQDGNYVFLGSYWHPNDELEQYFVISTLYKTDTIGNLLWKRKYYHTENHSRNILWDIKQSPEGGYVMCGETQDEFGLTGNQTQHIWVIHTDSYGCLVPGCQYVDIQEAETGMLSISVYPNPVQDFLYVFNPLPSQNLKGKILDISGKLVKADIILPAQTTSIIPFLNLSQGMYIFTVQLPDGKIFSERIIKN